MFARRVIGNDFCSDIGDKLFPNIEGGFYDGDSSLLTVARALLGRRTEENVEIKIVDVVDDVPKMPFKEGFSGIVICNFLMVDAEEYVKKFRKMIEEEYRDFKVIDALGKFCAQNLEMPALFAVNAKAKQAIVVAHDLKIQRTHFLCSLIPRLLPWYFAENPVVVGKKVHDEEEYELLVSVTQRDPSRFDRAVAALYKRYDFRDAIITSKLADFEANFHKSQLDNIKQEIERVRNNIRSLEDRFSEEYRVLDQKTTIQAGLIEKIKRGEDGNSEVKDLFLSCKNLNLKEVNGSEVTFVVATTMENFNPDDFEQTIKNEHSFWYRTESGQEYSPDWNDEQIEKSLRAIFEDEILKIKTCAAYSLDFATGRFRGISGYNYGPEFADYMPNQHIHQYSCIGSGHERQLREAMLNRNYCGAINVCIASAGNMSMTEVPTGEHHMKYLLSNHPGKCIILPDGSEVTPKEAMKWLEENKGGEE